MSGCLPCPENGSWVSQLRAFPSLLLFHGSLQLSPSVAMELCCLAGVLLGLAALVFRAMRCSLTFLLLWLLYLSLYKVGIKCVSYRVSVIQNVAYIDFGELLMV